MVLTYRFWTDGPAERSRRCSARPCGSAIASATIVGVLEPSVPYPSETEIIANVVTSPHHLSATMVDGRVHRMTELFGRLAPGVDLEAARAELRTVHGAMVKEHPESYPANADFRIDAVRLRDQIVSPARTVLLVLLAASALVFVIACSNVANLILARSVRREGELAIRAALGASTGALRRTLLAESLLLCGAGAILGVLIARPMVAILARYASRFSVRALDLTVDASLLWVGVGAGRRRGGPARVRAASAVGGSVERLRAVERQRADHLGHESAAAALRGDADRRVVRPARRRRHAADDAAVAAVGAHRLQHAQRAGDQRAGRLVRPAAGADRGVLPRGAATHRASCPASSGSRSARSFRGATPAVSGRASSSRSRAMRRRTARRIRAARFRTISPGFFAALGVPILAGRDFNDADRRDAEPVVIVSQSVARRMFPTQDALNRKLMWTDPVMKFIDVSTGPRRIVGIAADVDDENIVPGPALSVYHPFEQEIGGGRLFVHAKSDPYALVPPITRIIRELSPEQPVEQAATLEDVRAEVLAPDRLNALVFGGFATVALTIAVVGVAGVLAFSVSARTREFGIRLAIGSAPRHLLTRVLGEGAVIAVAGIVAGVSVRPRPGVACRALFHRRADAGRIDADDRRRPARRGGRARVADAGGAGVARRRHRGAARRLAPRVF